MLKLYFYAVVDELSESVVNIFNARNIEHAKMIVKNSLKDSDSRVTQFFKLFQLSDMIMIENDFDSIVSKEPWEYHSIRVDDILNENKES